MLSRLIRLIQVVFLNGAMLSVSDKYDSVNECTQEISKLIKLHLQGVWQNARELIRQLAHCYCRWSVFSSYCTHLPNNALTSPL